MGGDTFIKQIAWAGPKDTANSFAVEYGDQTVASPPTVARRARRAIGTGRCPCKKTCKTMCGKGGYHVLENNCEHFATKCVTGKKISLQSNQLNADASATVYAAANAAVIADAVIATAATTTGGAAAAAAAAAAAVAGGLYVAGKQGQYRKGYPYPNVRVSIGVGQGASSTELRQLQGLGITGLQVVKLKRPSLLYKYCIIFENSSNESFAFHDESGDILYKNAAMRKGRHRIEFKSGKPRIVKVEKF